MNSDVVYQVVKALPLEEQKLLLDKLKNDFSISSSFKKAKKRKSLTEEDAISYLLKNVFRNRKQ
ncbi:hypothetical protein DS884_16390 [Tenacibaculum sp. E3R01]|uniref:hypothetical protein n=1 Tax=Tenacibaculum sp. E3R01 TaxID=2267227 RepID=UPI000DE8EE7B|nr:hypothetical protein [Tenacibaculum sp. E3R01]RBW55208.1 hypothetical protein DS884_16390 [Tenacibaculum sp. E3R01]